MKRILITFGGSAYEATTQRTVEDGRKFGADAVYVYDDVWLRAHPFYVTNRWLFDLPAVRGLCWFAWKPLVIMDALERFCADGDVVCFIDGDTYPIADMSPLFDRCVSDGGQMLFAAQGCDNLQFCKSDCWIVMAADEVYPGRRAVELRSQHAVARFMLFQKGHWHVKQFLMEWLAYCLNPLATTFEKSKITDLGEQPGFHEHRTEQAILSLLAHKYGFHLYREADGYGDDDLAKNATDSWYPRIFTQVYGAGPRNNNGSRYRNV